MRFQAQLSGDAGLLPIRQFDQQTRFTESFAGALSEQRTGDIRHSNLEMVRQRIYGILILNSLDDVGRRLARIDVTPSDPRDEACLQQLLYSHPELLPVDEFDEFFSPPIPIGREVGTDRGPIDDLFVSPFGRITVVETKLWNNPENG